MTVLVTGAGGFIGRTVVRRLLDEGIAVAAVDRSGAFPADGDPLRRADWRSTDLARPFDDPGWPARCDAVIHLAQSARFREFPDGADDLFSVNCHATLRLLDYARRAGARRFLLASSGSLYARSPRPIPEEATVSPPDFYALTKLVAEQIAGAYRPWLEVAALRLFCVYGPGQRDRLVPNLIRRVRAGEPVVVEGDGGLRINPLHVRDAAGILRRLIDTPAAPAVLNVGGPEAVSIMDMARRIGVLVGRAPNLDRRPSQGEQGLVGDIGALRRALGDVFTVPFDDGLRETVQEAVASVQGPV